MIYFFFTAEESRKRNIFGKNTRFVDGGRRGEDNIQGSKNRENLIGDFRPLSGSRPRLDTLNPLCV